MSRVVRKYEIARRRKRRNTLRKIRARLMKASPSQKAKLMEKVHKIAPWVKDNEWLNANKAQEAQLPSHKRAA